MIIRKSQGRTLLALNYESLVTALALVFFLENLHLITLYPVLKTILNVLQFGFLGCIGLLFARQKVSRGNMLLRMLIVAVFMVSTLASGTFPYLKYGLVLIAGIHCKLPVLYKNLMKIYGIGLVLVILLGMLGILPSTIVRRGYSTYGFTHSNSIAAYILAVLCCYVLCNGTKLRLRNYVFMVFLIVASWMLTDSRTSALAMVLLLVFCAMGKWGIRLLSTKRILRYIVILTPVFMLVFSIFMGSNFDAGISIFSAIDSTLNGRLNLANQFMEILSIPLFGQRVEMTLVENAYLSGLYYFGLIPMVVQLAIYMYGIHKCIKNRDFISLACFLTFAIHGLAESSTFGPFQNVVLFSVFCSNMVSDYETIEQRSSNQK